MAVHQRHGGGEFVGNDATIQLFRILGGFLRMSFVGTLSRDTYHQRWDFGTLSSWWLNLRIWKICSSIGIISPRKGEKKHFLKLVILDSNRIMICGWGDVIFQKSWLPLCSTLEYTDLPNWIQPKNILCVFSLFFFWAGIDDSLFTNEGGRSLIIGGKLTKSTTNSCMLHLSYFQFGEGVFVFWAACQIIRCHPQNNYRQQKQLLHFATLLPWLAGIFSCCCSICSCFGG